MAPTWCGLFAMPGRGRHCPCTVQMMASDRFVPSTARPVEQGQNSSPADSPGSAPRAHHVPLHHSTPGPFRHPCLGVRQRGQRGMITNASVLDWDLPASCCVPMGACHLELALRMLLSISALGPSSGLVLAGVYQVGSSCSQAVRS